MKHYLEVTISSFISGLMIALGATVYLSCLPANKIIGSFMFGLGLFTIIFFKQWLYTGKVGFVLDNKPKYLIDLVLCFAMNIIGVVVTCLLISLTRAGDTLTTNATALVNAKQNDTWYSILILSIFCGMMIYLAVKGQQVESKLAKILFVFLPVSLFILCGFEHVIANAAYYTYARVFDAKTVLYFALMFIGNAIGSIILDLLFKGVEKFRNN
ncbi:MAG: formate/nitrite transporter family protein [Bacilli bacterium]|nr:formate/nitrite transporter family protein [Bacilli bacterium]